MPDFEQEPVPEPLPPAPRPPKEYPTRTEEEWLALRRDDITSTECAALFGLSPYETPFELWHRKRLGEDAHFEEHEYTKWGRRLQAAIAEGVAEDHGWLVRHAIPYMRHGFIDRMGASFDCRIWGRIGQTGTWDVDFEGVTLKGEIILEIKNVDTFAFKHGWALDGQTLEAPAHIELQVQHQMEVADINWAIIAALVGGNKSVLLLRERDPVVGKVICQKVSGFWASVRDNQEPAPDFARDAKFIARLYGFAEPGKVCEPVGSEADRIVALLEEYHTAGQVAEDMDNQRDACKAEILTLIGDAERLLVPGFSVSAGMVGPKHVEYDAKGYRNFRVTKKKPQGE